MISAQAKEHTADSEHRNNELPLQSRTYGKCEIGFLITFSLCVVKTDFVWHMNISK